MSAYLTYDRAALISGRTMRENGYAPVDHALAHGLVKDLRSAHSLRVVYELESLDEHGHTLWINTSDVISVTIDGIEHGVRGDDD